MSDILGRYMGHHRWMDGWMARQTDRMRDVNGQTMTDGRARTRTRVPYSF